jgi:hypothetical protein
MIRSFLITWPFFMTQRTRSTSPMPYAGRARINSHPTIKKRGNASGVSPYYWQLAALLHFAAQPPPLGRIIHDASLRWLAPSHQRKLRQIRSDADAREGSVICDD